MHEIRLTNFTLERVSRRNISAYSASISFSNSSFGVRQSEMHFPLKIYNNHYDFQLSLFRML